jgi:hypothetical protein
LKFEFLRFHRFPAEPTGKPVPDPAGSVRLVGIKNPGPSGSNMHHPPKRQEPMPRTSGDASAGYGRRRVRHAARVRRGGRDASRGWGGREGDPGEAATARGLGRAASAGERRPLSRLSGRTRTSASEMGAGERGGPPRGRWQPQGPNRSVRGRGSSERTGTSCRASAVRAGPGM